MHTHTHTGKTTLADSLVASNGIISQRQAGKVSRLYVSQFSTDLVSFPDLAIPFEAGSLVLKQVGYLHALDSLPGQSGG